MVRTMFLALSLVMILCRPSVGQETAAEQAPAPPNLLEQFIQAFSGRWVSEFIGDEDIEGYVSKGEKVRLETFNMATVDNSALRIEWQLAKDGVVRGRSSSLLTWDPAAQVLRVLGSATGGFLAETTFTKEDDKWLQKSILTFPDGSHATSRSTILLSADGKTQTVLITDRVDHTGQKLPDTTAVWQRVSKNSEALKKHLGWLIGDWTGKADFPVVGEITINNSFKWIARGEVIQLDMKGGEWEGLSIIFFDSSDGAIKMWGANSSGGNGQAVMRPEGESVVWTNTVFDADGKKSVADFIYKKGDGGNELHVIVVGAENGKRWEVTLNKK